MDARLASTRLAKCQCVFLLFVVAIPIGLYFGVVVYSVRQTSGGQCPVGFLACNPNAENVTCVERRHWCDLTDHCPGAEDEDVIDCYEAFGYHAVFLDKCWNDLSLVVAPTECKNLSYPVSCTCKHTTVKCDRIGYTETPSGLSPETANLDLSYNNISRIRRDDFSQFTNLGSLYLNYNALADIQPGSFRFQSTSLVILSLNWNLLTTIRPGMFSGLGNLSHLLLGHNAISEILAGSFDGLDRLCYLSIARQQQDDDGIFRRRQHASESGYSRSQSEFHRQDQRKSATSFEPPGSSTSVEQHPE